MNRRIFIVNSVKGGCGKSTVSMHLARYLQKKLKGKLESGSVNKDNYDFLKPVIIDLDLGGSVWSRSFSKDSSSALTQNGNMLKKEYKSEDFIFIHDMLYNADKYLKRDFEFHLKFKTDQEKKEIEGLLAQIDAIETEVKNWENVTQAFEEIDYFSNQNDWDENTEIVFQSVIRKIKFLAKVLFADSKKEEVRKNILQRVEKMQNDSQGLFIINENKIDNSPNEDVTFVFNPENDSNKRKQSVIESIEFCKNQFNAFINELDDLTMNIVLQFFICERISSELSLSFGKAKQIVNNTLHYCEKVTNINIDIDMDEISKILTGFIDDLKNEVTNYVDYLRLVLCDSKDLKCLNSDDLELLESLVFKMVKHIWNQSYLLDAGIQEAPDIVFDLPPGYEKHADQIVRHLVMDLRSPLNGKKYEDVKTYLCMVSNVVEASIDTSVDYVKNMRSGRNEHINPGKLENGFFVLNDVNHIFKTSDPNEIKDYARGIFTKDVLEPLKGGNSFGISSHYDDDRIVVKPENYLSIEHDVCEDFDNLFEGLGL